MIEKLIEAVVTIIVQKQTLPRRMKWEDKKNLMRTLFPAFTDDELDQHKPQILKSFAKIQKKQIDDELAREEGEPEEESLQSLPDLDRINLHSVVSCVGVPTPPESSDIQEVPLSELQSEVDDTINVSHRTIV